MTKTRILFLLLCCAIFQSNGFSQIDFKFYAGTQISNYWNNLEDFNFNDIPLMAYSVDARLSFFSNSKFQLETGVGLNQKGQFFTAKNLEKNGTDISFRNIEKYSQRNYYLEIPIQANLFFKEANKGLFIFGSVRPNYILIEKTKSVYLVGPTQKTTNPYPDTEKFNMLARAGIGYEIPFSKFGISISTYFEHEMINNAIGSDLSFLEDYKLYYYSAGLMAGIRF